jgi:hypothetical protein
MGWANVKPVSRPEFTWKTVEQSPILEIQGGEEVRWFLVRSEQKEQWTAKIVDGHDKLVRIEFASRPQRVAVSAVDRAGNESPPKIE